MQRVILASSSPRRRDLLASAGVPFEVDPAEVDETHVRGEDPAGYVRRMALAKCLVVSSRRREAGDLRAVLAADTVVVLDGRVLGKPRDRDHARSMLALLSGREHRVLTGYCLQGPDGAVLQDEVATDVRFKPLRAPEIARYLDTDEWRDKAGAYAVQGRAAFMVASVHGSYTNVVGLPLAEVLEALCSAPWSRTRADGAEGR